ncbi:MAG: CPBP family intramembrane glutamic endopeptidase [Sphaerochaetaceae bacterium]|jgi:membrane protease YdiL (CAAX protease family)|nr:CPBP family intramembrane glutamic endopeptidase [Sphaerochaetaceae bacterium]
MSVKEHDVDSLEFSPAFPVRLSVPVWAASFIIIELIWTFAGGFVTFQTDRLVQLVKINEMLKAYLTLHVNFIVLLIVLLIFLRLVAKTSFTAFITESKSIRWSLMFTSALIWSGAIGIITIIATLLGRNGIQLYEAGTITDRTVMLAVVVIFTSVQCIAEELLFRTFIWRAAGKRHVAALVLSAIVFTLAHLANNEVVSSQQPLWTLAYYALVGMIFMEMTIASDGSEAAIGAHLANNLFLAIVVNYRGSTLETLPLFMQDRPGLLQNLLTIGIAGIMIIAWIRRRQCSQINKSDIRLDQ